VEMRVCGSAQDGSVGQGQRLRLFGGAPGTAQARTRAVYSANHSLIQQLKEAEVHYQRPTYKTRVAHGSHTSSHRQQQKSCKEERESRERPVSPART